MKQAADKYTEDMFPAPKEGRTFYRAYLTLDDGTVLVWTNLTLAKAKAMYKMHGENFNNRQSSKDMNRFGWEEMK